jgi:pyruvate,water dikinase
MPDPDGCFNLWDNSNIAESYSGVTTPLTFSFAREIYEEVYRQFCRILRVPEAKIAANRDTFRRMLGLIDGRVYYNLLSWYRVLALLPGYTVNRRFMEQMMGVKESLPEGALPLAEPAGWRAKLRDGFDLLSSVCGLIGNHFSLPRNIERFYDRLNTALAAPVPALEEMRPDELAAAYRDLEARLLTRWDAPLINDFFAMIFYGLSKRLVEKWRPGVTGNLQNDLIRGGGGMISAEPGRRVREMAALAAGTPDLVETLCTGSPDEIQDALAAQPMLKKQFDEYLEKFGDRCIEELKLESATLHDDPAPLLRSIGHLAKRGVPPAIADAEPSHNALDAMRGHPVRRVILTWVLRHAQARVRDRENLRFERTRLFGRVRRIFVELGRRFHAIGVLDDPRDIFYVTIEEALGFIEGTAASKDLHGLARVRAAEFARYREAAPPADRFETRGAVDHGNTYQTARKSVVDEAAEQMTGIGCCAGIVRGRARVVRDPRNAMIQFGEVLVAERTDPGWIMLFPSAAGLLVEHGSLLSHSAIVAREMGIPAIVSIAGVTRWLRDGDWVELDGSSGVVRKLAPPDE